MNVKQLMKYSNEQLTKMIVEADGTVPAKATKKELATIYRQLRPNGPPAPTTPANGMDTLTSDDAVLQNPLEVVFREGILFRIDGHCWWGKSSRVDEDEIQVPREFIFGVKTLIEDKNMATLKGLRHYGERVVKSKAYPFLGLRGVYYVPKAFIVGCEKELQRVRKKFYSELDRFIEKYPEMKEAWKEKSGKYYNEALYPTAEQIRSKFRFNWTKFVITLPDSTMGILTSDEIKEELDKQRQNATEFINESITVLASKFIQMLSKLKERIGDEETLRPKSLASIQTFLESFQAWNFTRNPDLTKMVEESKQFLADLNVKDVNDDKKLRKTINKQITAVIKEFESKAETDARFQRALDF